MSKINKVEPRVCVKSYTNSYTFLLVFNKEAIDWLNADRVTATLALNNKIIIKTADIDSSKARRVDKKGISLPKTDLDVVGEYSMYRVDEDTIELTKI